MFIAINSYQTINDFIKTTTKKSPYYPKAFRQLQKTVIVSKNISSHEDFLVNYQENGHQIKNSLVALYQDKKTPDSYYLAYKLSKNEENLYQALYLANKGKMIDIFIKKHPKINDLPNLLSIKLKIFRAEKKSNGYLKAFAISQDKKDIKLAFDYSKNKSEEKKAEQSLENFLYPMKAQAEACLSGSISSSKRSQHPELIRLCDTPDRDYMALGLCVAIAGGGCEILTSQIDNPLVQKLPKSLCRQALSKIASGTSELSDFDTFHLVDALTYARKQSFSSNSSLIRTFLGGYFALGEGLSRVAVSDQCKARLRSKCAILYGVCR